MRALLVLMALTLAAPLAIAQSVEGVWEGEYWITNRLEKATFTLKVDGDKLTGRVTRFWEDRKLGDYEIVNGKIENDQISFAIPVNYGPTVKAIEYSGEVSGNEIAFTHSFQGWKRQAELLTPRSSQFTARRP
jgi:hypothetical protein